MAKKSYRWSVTLGLLAAAMLLGLIPGSTRGESPVVQPPSRLVLVEQLTSTN